MTTLLENSGWNLRWGLDRNRKNVEDIGVSADAAETSAASAKDASGMILQTFLCWI